MKSVPKAIMTMEINMIVDFFICSIISEYSDAKIVKLKEKAGK
jgi:hypothetical protein